MLNETERVMELFSVYTYDSGSGAFVKAITGLPQASANLLADQLHHSEGFLIKIVDEFDGVVVDTRG